MSSLLNAMCRIAVVSALAAACLVFSGTTADAEPSASGGATVAPVGAAGQWIHVDPQTGARKAGPAPDAAAAVAADPAFSTSHAGLVEEPAPGGGVTVNLQGRFRSAVTATVGPDGKVTVDCHSPGVHAGGE